MTMLDTYTCSCRQTVIESRYVSLLIATQCTYTHTHRYSAMETFGNKAQNAISRMITEMLLLSSFSVQSGDRFLDIRLETKFVPSIKKKKHSPSCLRRNQRRLLLFLEKNRAAESTELVNTGSMDGSTGEHLLTGATTSAEIKRDGPALPNNQIKEIDDNQDNSTNPEEEGSDKDECKDEG